MINTVNQIIMKLYKFRPLTGKDSLKRAKSIIKEGFYCAKFTELNDPMEGIFSTENEESIKIIYKSKFKTRICSFSGEEGFKKQIMWGYYTNGFKGIAIEIEIEIEKTSISQINYNNTTHKTGNIKKILTTKREEWKHENEYRFLIDNEEEKHKISKIKSIYFGNPYGDTENQEDIIKGSKTLKEYMRNKEELIKLANSKGINCFNIVIRNGEVIKGATKL